MQYVQKISVLITAIIGVTMMTADTRVAALAIASPAGLTISQLKMTGDEFVVITNNSGSTINDLSAYWLTAYNNVNPLAAGISSSSQQLPAAGLAVGQALLLSAQPMQTCGAQVAGKLSVSLSDSGGFLQLSRAEISGTNAVQHSPQDAVGWSSGTSGAITAVPSASKSPHAVFFRHMTDSGSYAWQMATLQPANACQLTLVVAGDSESPSAVTPLTLAAISPPATVIGEAPSAANVPTMPPGNIGLLAPQLSELLPNPQGTGNDKTDEFIELYNPNDKPFELSGFILQIGTTRKYNYVFPVGTMLPAKTFKAFYASETKLSLSNTSGHASLFDPFGTHLVSSAAYSSAKDGVAWAIANNTWQWSAKITPNAANIITAPPTKKTSSKNSVKTGQAQLGSVKGGATTGAQSSANSQHAEEQNAAVHSWVLAMVGVCAILYGAYEYRKDIANTCHKLRSKLSVGRRNRKPT